MEVEGAGVGVKGMGWSGGVVDVGWGLRRGVGVVEVERGGEGAKRRAYS